MRGRPLRVWLTYAFILLLLGCERASAPEPSPKAASGFPVRSIDDTGRQVVLKREPLRIVTLLPSFTETVFALGAGAHVVGVDDFSDYPEEVKHLPKLGGAYDTQIERVLSLSPDLVLLSDDSKAAAVLVKNGVQVWGGSPRKFEDVFRVIEATARLLGRLESGRKLTTNIRRELLAIEKGVAGMPSVSVYYELDPTPYSVGPDSFIGVLIKKAGGQNIVPGDLGDFPKLNPELILAADPMVILGASLRDVAARPGWERLAAVKSGRVYDWQSAEGQLLSRPGPRLPQALRTLVQKLHPNAQ